LDKCRISRVEGNRAVLGGHSLANSEAFIVPHPSGRCNPTGCGAAGWTS
jgi:hypothetical protein